MTERRLSRRGFILAISAAAAPMLLASCAQPPAPTATSAPKPAAEPPKPAAPTSAPAAAATKPAAPAAAATKPAEPTKPAATTAPAATKPAEATKPAAQAPAASGQKVKLLFWKHNYDAADKLTTELIKEFQAQNPNIDVAMEIQPNQGFSTKILTGLAGDVGLDMFDLSDPLAASYIAKGLLAPLKPDAFGFKDQAEMEKAWIPGSLNMFKGKDGKLYAVHFEFNSWSLFVNQAHYKEVGLDSAANAPKTWNDLKANAEKLTKREGNRITRSGFEWGDSLGPNWTMLGFPVILYQLGGSILADDDKGSKATINSPEGVEALTLYTSPIREWKVTTLGFGVKTPANANDNFGKGLTSQWMTGPWAPPSFKNSPEVYNNYKVVQLPQAANGKRKVVASSGWGWFANVKSQKQDAVWKFTDYASKQQPRWLKDVGYILPRLGWFETPEAKAFKDLDVFLKDMELARPRLQHPNYPEIEAAVGRAVDRVLSDGMDPKKSLDTAAEDINKVTGG